MKKFILDVDVVSTVRVTYEVWAENPEQAQELFNQGEGKQIDPDPENKIVVGDEWDIRYVTDAETGQEIEL